MGFIYLTLRIYDNKRFKINEGIKQEIAFERFPWFKKYFSFSSDPKKKIAHLSDGTIY